MHLSGLAISSGGEAGSPYAGGRMAGAPPPIPRRDWRCRSIGRAQEVHPSIDWQVATAAPRRAGDSPSVGTQGTSRPGRRWQLQLWLRPCHTARRGWLRMGLNDIGASELIRLVRPLIVILLSDPGAAWNRFKDHCSWRYTRRQALEITYPSNPNPLPSTFPVEIGHHQTLADHS